MVAVGRGGGETRVGLVAATGSAAQTPGLARAWRVPGVVNRRTGFNESHHEGGRLNSEVITTVWVSLASATTVRRRHVRVTVNVRNHLGGIARRCTMSLEGYASQVSSCMPDDLNGPGQVEVRSPLPIVVAARTRTRLATGEFVSHALPAYPVG